MGRSSSRNHHKIPRSQTLPSSPTHSSSSSDFEFTVSISPRKSTTNLIPADQLFYKGQLLPLHLSPRLSMVRTLLLASSSTSSSDTTTTASRHSTASSSSDFPDSRDSSRRPSSVTDDDTSNSQPLTRLLNTSPTSAKKPKYFSLSRFSSVFRKEPKLPSSTTTTITYDTIANTSSQNSVKRVSSTAKDVIRKYLKKVKPLYEKLSQKQGASTKPPTASSGSVSEHNSRLKDKSANTISHSFSGNLRYPRRRSCVASCPSSMRSSPNHSGVLSRTGATLMSKQFNGAATTSYSSEASSMEELHSAIQGAIAHCKNSMNFSNNNNGCSTSGSSSATLVQV
ncbi:probable membrane-associated kinase regulator 1 isoform X1 [Daucus carota subsp. sativus]|uniref:probable membrane-associated kinase regulator 1 isoform X1 n=1 Tax=Daucus carota subsp. sativus TaxID=79200 RepID=UPI0007EF0051|nr:PREDICTED: probable membrane-associated kinase regulator 1 isoform X1 [Daucus carota subsp. sativus]